MNRSARATLVLSALVLLAPAARGQTPDEVEIARTHFARGLELINEARWQDAIEELQAARAIRETAPVAFNLGLAQRAVGQYRDAIGSFRRFLDLAGAQLDAARRAEVEGYLSEMTAALAQLRLRVLPADANVTVDDTRVAPGAEPIELDPGRHRLVVAAPGHTTQTRELDLARGARAELELRLAPVETRARLRVESNVPLAMVRIDGREVGNGAVDERLPPGRHLVEVRAPGYHGFRRVLSLEPRERARVRATLVPMPTPVTASPVFWAGTAVVVVGGAVLGGVLLLSRTEDPYIGRLGVVTGAITGAR